MSFLEMQFPDEIAFGAIGGPVELTKVIVTGAGFEQRDARWATPRGKWNVATGLKTPTDAEDLVAFFRLARGRFHGFRYKDVLDFKSVLYNQATSDTDQDIGTGDAAETEFQLRKLYTFAARKVFRDIVKPRAGTVKVALDGVPQTGGTDFIVDISRGVVLFFTAPGVGVKVTAGFEFDVPVRFESDEMHLSGDTFEISAWREVMLIELRAAELEPMSIDFTAFTTSAASSMDARLVHIRGSQATYFNASGLLRYAGSTALRITHDLSGNVLGALLERLVVNRLLDIRDYTQSSWVKTNLTATKDQLGIIEFSGTEASRLTADAALATIYQSITLGSLERTTSYYVKRLTGTGTIEITMDGGSTFTDITSLINSSTYSRVDMTQTLANPNVGFRISTSGDEIAVDFSQIEDGAYPTSPIDVSLGDTRNADDLTINTTDWFNPSGGTFRIKALLDFVPTRAPDIGLMSMFNSADTSNRITMIKDLTNDKVRVVYDDGTGAANVDDSQVWNKDAVRTILFGYADLDQDLTVDGSPEGSAAKGLPTDIDTARIGRADANVTGEPYFDGSIALFSYFPSKEI